MAYKSETKLGLSLLGLVHKSGNGIYWFSALIKVYKNVFCSGWGKALILNPENMSIKEKSPCQTVNIEKESLCQVKVCKKWTLCPAKGSKKLHSQRVKNFSYNT